MYLGVDQALGNTGVVVLSADSHRPLYLDTIRTGSTKGAKRLQLIRDSLTRIIQAYGVTFAALEGYSIRSVNRPFDLGEVGGVVRLCFLDQRVEYVTVAPTSLKKYVSGSGRADKKIMRRATLEKWGIDIDQNDACDAYGLAHIARAIRESLPTTDRAELEVVRGLKAGPKSKIITRSFKKDVEDV